MKREAGGDTAAVGSTGTESAKVAGVADSKNGQKTAGDVGSAASAKVSGGAAPNASVKTAAKVNDLRGEVGSWRNLETNVKLSLHNLLLCFTVCEGMLHPCTPLPPQGADSPPPFLYT